MTPEDCRDVEAGARVVHTIFGPGTVIQTGDYDGHMFGDMGFIEIKFDHHGTKQLCIGFAAEKLDREWP